MKANQDTYPVGVMCRLLKVSTSGFYGWWDRPMSAHDRRDVEFAALVHSVYERSHRTYGGRRVHAEFRESLRRARGAQTRGRFDAPSGFEGRAEEELPVHHA